MAEEYFDIYDEQLNHLGTAPRSTVHQSGFWHQTFHCWIYFQQWNEMYILFQRRHPRKDTFPGHYDITCAGHLTAGEQPEDGVREISEELGLQVSFHDLQPLGVHKLVNLDGPLVDREISHVYAYRCAQALDQYILQPDEVSSLVKMNLDQALSLFSGTQSSAIVEGVALQPDGQMTCLSETVTLTDFVPHGAPYYLQVLQTIRSFCQKE